MRWEEKKKGGSDESLLFQFIEDWRLKITILFYFYCFVQPLMPFNHKTDDVSNYNRRNKLQMPVSHFTLWMENFHNRKENNGMEIRGNEWADRGQQYGD